MDHLSQVARAAREAGMSYGKYVALRYERNGFRPEKRPEPIAEPPEGERRCAVCGTVLPPGTHGHRKTCSRTCSDELNRRRNAGYYRKNPPEGSEPDRFQEFVFPERKAICRNCRAEFSLKDIHGATKYCSERCRREYANRAARLRYTPDRATNKKQPRIGKCGVCGKEFAVSLHARKYCSGECARSANLAHARARDAQRRENAREEKEEC